MKKVLAIIGIVFVVLLAVLVMMAIKDKEARGPEQTFAFYNSYDQEISVTFHELKEDKSYGGYIENILIKPGEVKFEPCTRGGYKINIWNGNVEDEKTERLRSIEDIKVELADDKDNYNPIYIDTTGEYFFAVVDVNFIYSGSSLANTLSESMGTARTKPVVKLLKDGKKPFCLPPHYGTGTFVRPNDKMPKEISSGTIVYALVPIPNTVKKSDEVLEYVYQFIQDRIE